MATTFWKTKDKGQVWQSKRYEDCQLQETYQQEIKDALLTVGLVEFEFLNGLLMTVALPAVGNEYVGQTCWKWNMLSTKHSEYDAIPPQISNLVQLSLWQVYR